MPAVSSSARITIVSLLVSLLLAFVTFSSLSAKPKVEGVPVKISYKFQGDKLSILGYSLEIHWEFDTPEEDKKYSFPSFYGSPGGKWILITFPVGPDRSQLWLYDKLSKAAPALLNATGTPGANVFWYEDKVVEFTYARMGFSRHTFLKLSENVAVAGLVDAIFYDVKKDIYLALRRDFARDTSYGLLEVGRLYGGKGQLKGKLERLKLKSKQYRDLPAKWISEIIFDKETMIVKVDWADKTRYVKFHPEFLKGRK